MKHDLTALYEQLDQLISSDLGAGAAIAIALLVIVLAAVWILLPFAIIGTKGRIDRVLERLDAIAKELTALNTQIYDLRTAPPKSIKFVNGETKRAQEATKLDLEV